MTPIQKSSIALLRTDGYSYGEIAGRLDVSRDAAISFCRRRGIQQVRKRATASIQKITEENLTVCRECGALLKQQEGMKRRIFCCKDCRVKWWNSHPEQLNKKALYSFTCARCGKTFTAYGNKSRKYCCHECYIAERFGVQDKAD